MRIAILSCFYPYRGGIAQFNAALLGELGRNNEVKAFNFTRQYPEILFPGKTQFVTEDDEAVQVQSEALLDTVNPLSYFRTYRAICNWKPDLVLVRYWMSWFAPSLGYVTRHLKKQGIKVISILDNVIPHEPHFFDRLLTGYFLQGSNACVTLCDAVEKDLREIDGNIPCKVIPHPLYSHFGEKLDRKSALEALGLNADRKTLLFFGLIRKYKGLDILLKAFSGLGEDYQLIIAGEPYGSFDEYQALIDKMDKSRISVTLKYIKDSEVKRYFSCADLCVLPYRSATQSGVSAISFHFDVPMLVTDVGGLREAIAETGTGMLVGECDENAVRTKIEEYFSDSSIKDTCIKNIQIQKELLSWSSFARNLLDFAKTL